MTMLRIAVRVAGYAVGFFLILAAAVSLYGMLDRDARADVAVVLGNEVYVDGNPAPRLAARLDRAVILFHNNRCRIIIVSGGVGKSGRDEASAMGTYLRNHGIPTSAIVYDHKGISTWETARFTSEYMQRNRLSSVIVVSQYFHIARSELALRFLGVGNVGRASPWYFELRDVDPAFQRRQFQQPLSDQLVSVKETPCA